MAGERMCKNCWQAVAACVVLIIMAFSSGCNNRPNDAELVTSIQSQMFADAQLRGASVQVTVSQGVVTIKGTLPTDAAKYEAYKIATQTSGVTKVNDQTTVDQSVTSTSQPEPAPPPPAAQPVQPTATARDKARPSHRPVIKQTEPVEMADNAAPPSSDTQEPPPSLPPAPTPPTAPEPLPPPPPPPPQPKQVQIPASTKITIRMIDAVDSSVNKTGDVFHASLDAPIMTGNDVLVPKGADVYVRLANASSAGKITGQSELRLELVKLEFQGQSYPLVSSTYEVNGASRGKDTAKKVGVGAVLGAVIGGIAGGGKGAAVGATVGGGAGGVYQGVTHGQQVKIASETKLDFQLEQPVTIAILPS